MNKGFPRPWSDRHKSPVAYTAKDRTAPGEANDSRISECIRDELCTVCGLELDDQLWLAVSHRTHTVTVTDPGMAHRKCAKLATLFCPAFKRKDVDMVCFDKQHALELIKKTHAAYQSRESNKHLIDRFDFIWKDEVL